MPERAPVWTVQILRGVAAVLVLLYHLQPMLNANYPGTGLHASFGAFGVDIFFVISGFVMYYSNATMRRPIGAFLLMRLLRIAPLYWIATLLLIALFFAGFRPVGLHMLDARIVLQSALFIPSDFPGGRHDLILSIGWTLIYELFFYCCFALSFRVGTPVRSLAAVSALFGALAIFGAVFRPSSYMAGFFTSSIIIEFLYGGMLALLYARGRAGRAPLGLAAIALGFGVVLALGARGVPVPGRQGLRFLLYGLPAAFVVGGALALERHVVRAPMRAPLLLGAASYALYLFHPLLLQIAIKAMTHVLPAGTAWHAIAAGCVAVIATIVAAILIHRLVEAPMLRIGRRWISALRANFASRPMLAEA